MARGVREDGVVVEMIVSPRKKVRNSRGRYVKQGPSIYFERELSPLGSNIYWGQNDCAIKKDNCDQYVRLHAEGHDVEIFLQLTGDRGETKLVEAAEVPGLYYGLNQEWVE